MSSLKEIAFNTIMNKLCKDLSTEIDNLILLLKSKKELTREELTNINNIAINIIKEFSIKINSKDNTYVLDIHGKKTSISINTELKHSTAVYSKLPTWMQPKAFVNNTRKKLLKHSDVRDNYIHKINLYLKPFGKKQCISSAYNILEIIKDIKLKSAV
tara:strand:+ start:138 stop:611 length:474 start_codon:yes stop_codon:yes gene_type:complete